MTPEQQARADALRLPALIAAPESIHRHDPDVTFAFNKIFAHPDNADTVRAFVVGLPINDPAKPVVEEVDLAPAEAAEVTTYGDLFSSESSHDTGYSVEGIRFVDDDGDELRIARVTPNTHSEEKPERILFTVNGTNVVALSLAAADSVADWLDIALEEDDEDDLDEGVDA